MIFVILAIVSKALTPAEIGAALAVRCASDFNKSHGVIPAENEYNFANWNYEGGTIQVGLWELTEQLITANTSATAFVRQQLRQKLNKHLNSSVAKDILTNQAIDWGYSVGDKVALYPTAYAVKLHFEGGTSTEQELVNKAANLIKTYPHQLTVTSTNESTVSRQVTWPAVGSFSPEGRGIWGDDAFMGSSILIATTVRDHLVEAGKQIHAIHLILSSNDNNLYYHGSLGPSHHSCCQWGRANGWAAMAKADILSKMYDLNMTSEPIYPLIMSAFLSHINGLLTAPRDSTTGLLHNVLSEPLTPPETSVTAMTLYAVCVGIQKGFLNASYETHAADLFTAVTSQISTNGSVSSVIGETGIKDRWEDYGTPGEYPHSAPGLGGVIRGIAAYLKLVG
eukprot:TRINITY_DN22924_c0_g1_i1.p1 TRINITY_DN22924_c0_g1~~TRINITY_DN22924_c0_g1_i1.p1  ORF type:complete len:407 (+),score=70.41 TRINITY_DN22924_c0_g1_i1:38-1222(+)